MVKKHTSATTRHRSYCFQAQKYDIDDSGLKKKHKIAHPLSGNGPNASAPIARHSINEEQGSNLLEPSSSASATAFATGTTGLVKAARNQQPLSSSPGGTSGMRDVGDAYTFSSIFSPTTSVEIIPIPMAIDYSSALLSSSSTIIRNPASSSLRETGKEEEAAIRAEHICRHIELVTEDPDTIRMPSWDEPITVYFSVTKPSVPCEVFVKRLVRRANISKRGFVHALMYLEKLRMVDEKLTLSPYNIHRLLMTALLIAGDYVDRVCYLDNLLQVVSVSEMDQLKHVMMSLLDCNLAVSQDAYSRFVNNLTNT